MIHNYNVLKQRIGSDNKLNKQKNPITYEPFDRNISLFQVECEVRRRLFEIYDVRSLTLLGSFTNMTGKNEG